LIVRSAAKNCFVVVGIYAFHRRNVNRRREIVDDGVEQRLNALVFERGTREHGNDFERERRFPNRLAHFVQGQGAFGQILVENFVVMFRNVFDNFRAMLVVELLIDRRALQGCSNVRPRIYKRLVPKFFDFKNFELGSEGFFEPNHHVLFQKIDNAD